MLKRNIKNIIISLFNQNYQINKKQTYIFNNNNINIHLIFIFIYFFIQLLNLFINIIKK